MMKEHKQVLLCILDGWGMENGAADGSIMLLHCNDITAEILPKILHDLKMQGYEFVTISELFARAGVDPVPNNGHYETTADAQ